MSMSDRELHIANAEAATAIVIALIEHGPGYKKTGDAKKDAELAAEAFKTVYAAIKGAERA